MLSLPVSLLVASIHGQHYTVHLYIIGGGIICRATIEKKKGGVAVLWTRPFVVREYVS